MAILLISNSNDICSILYKEDGRGGVVIRRYEMNEIQMVKKHNYDIIIIDYNQEMLKREEFKLIFDLNCKIDAPILAVLDGGSAKNKLNLIRFGVEDYIDRPIQEDELKLKIQNLLRLKRVMMRIEMNAKLEKVT